MRLQRDLRVFHSLLLVIGLGAAGGCRVQIRTPTPNSPVGFESVIREHTIRLAAGRTRSFLLDLSTDQLVEARVSQMGVRANLKVLDEYNIVLAETNGPRGPYSTESIFWVTHRSGKFRIEVSASRGNEPSFTLRLSARKRRAIRSDDDLVQAETAYMKAESAMAQSGNADAMKEARTQYEAALSLTRRADNPALEAEILNRYAESFASESNWGRSIELARQALESSGKAADASREIESLLNIGKGLVGLEKYSDARQSFEAALGKYRSASINQSFLLAGIYYNLATPAIYESQYRAATEFLSMSIQIYKTIHAEAEAVDALDDMGFSYQSMGNLDSALQFYQEALRLNRSEDRRRRAMLLDDLGRNYELQGQYAQSIERLRQSIELAVATGDRGVQELAETDLAYALRLLGEPESAIQQYQEALRLAEGLDDKRQQANILTQMAGCYRDAGQALKSIELAEQAISLARARKDEETAADGLSLRGLAYAATGQLEQAQADHQAALATYRNLKMRRGEGSALTNLSAAFLAQGKFETAIEYARQALPIERETQDPRAEAIALDTLMKSWSGRGETALAIFFGKQAVNIIQGLRANVSSLSPQARRDFVAANAAIYRNLAELLIHANRLFEAEQVLDLLKEREFIELLRDDSSAQEGASLNPQEDEWDQRYRKIASQLVSLGAERGTLVSKSTPLTKTENARLNVVEQDLASANIVYERFLAGLTEAFKSNPQAALRLAEVRQAQAFMTDLGELPSGTVAVYTLVSRDRYRAILVTPDVQKAYESSISDVDLNRKILAFRESVQNPASDPRELSRDLYDVLIRPLASDLDAAGAKTIMWSLDGSLRYLPLAALYDGKQYLIERYGLSVFTPASNARLKDLPAGKWTAAGFGVTKEHGDSPALPGAAEELESIISERVGGSGILQGEIRLDERFTESSFRNALRQHREVIHIASHFRFEPGNEMNSYLLLGDGSHFTLADLKNMPPIFAGVQLLTLSACNTGLSERAADGSEVEGLGVLAQKKGAKAVIASLWPVEDDSTSVLMSEFYRLRELHPDLPKIEALRQAQLEFLQGGDRIPGVVDEHRSARRGVRLDDRRVAVSALGFRHPFYWAPFFLIGNWL